MLNDKLVCFRKQQLLWMTMIRQGTQLLHWLEVLWFVDAPIRWDRERFPNPGQASPMRQQQEMWWICILQQSLRWRVKNLWLGNEMSQLGSKFMVWNPTSPTYIILSAYLPITWSPHPGCTPLIPELGMVSSNHSPFLRSLTTGRVLSSCGHRMEDGNIFLSHLSPPRPLYPWTWPNSTCDFLYFK